MKKRRGRPTHCKNCRKLKEQLEKAKDQIKLEQDFVRLYRDLYRQDEGMIEELELRLRCARDSYRHYRNAWIDADYMRNYRLKQFRTAQKRLRLLITLIIALGAITIIRVLI